MKKAYQEDLAYVHDVGFTKFIKESAPFILQTIKMCGINQGQVIDLGCGSGVWAKLLTDKGYKVLGVDISPHMIAIAQKRAPKADFKVGSFLNIDLPRCSVITALGEIFNYLFDETNNLKQLTQFFKRVYKALEPEGLFIFDIAEPGRLANIKQRNAMGKDWAMLVNYQEDSKTHHFIRDITVFRKIKNHYRRSQERHELQLYRGSQLAEILRNVGFHVRLTRGYGKHRFPKAYAGIIARK
jgi:SAM-dependent methyltransferase